MFPGKAKTEEDVLVSCPSSMPYVEAAEDSLEKTFQFFEVVRIASVDSLPRQPRLSDATMMVAQVMLGHGYVPGMGLGKNNSGRTGLVSIKGNRGKFGLGYKPTQADVRKNISEKKNKGQGPRSGQRAKEAPPCHISRSFVSACLRREGQVATMCGEDSPRRLDLV